MLYSVNSDLLSASYQQEPVLELESCSDKIDKDPNFEGADSLGEGTNRKP